MPLHISEIGVRLAVGGGPGPGGGSGPGPSAGSGAGPGGGKQSATLPPDQLDHIVTQTVQRVLEQLRALEAR